MRIEKSELPVRLNVPGAVARLGTDFGNASQYGDISAEYFSLKAGTDMTPLFKGLKDDLCQAPHWGYLAQGAMTVTYKDGSHDDLKGGDVFFLPPGHTVRVEQDAEIVMFSPQHEHLEVLDHVKAKLGV